MNDFLQKKFQFQHESLIHQVENLDEDFLMKEFDNKWSILTNLAHLGRYQEIYEMRIHAILTGHIPQFSRYTAESDSQWPIWQALNSSQIISKFRIKRRLLWEEISLFTTAQKQLEGIHPKFGYMNIINWTEFFLLHESHHHYRIFRIIHEHSTTA